jgi:hypothetical protein
MHTTWAWRARGKLLGEVVVVVEARSVAGRRDVGTKCRIGTEDLDGLKYGEPNDLEASLLKFCHFGISPSINDHIGHDIVCLKIIKGYDHPAGRGGGRGRDRVERGDR